jgi:hypothetical protein
LVCVALFLDRPSNASAFAVTVKFLHVRFCDPDTGELSTHGGCTVAYTATKKDIMVHLAMCRVPDQTISGNWDSGDRFCYAIGREIARGRLRNENPLEVLARTDPMHVAIIEWLSKYLTIEVVWDNVTNPKKPRWISAFHRSTEEPI